MTVPRELASSLVHHRVVDCRGRLCIHSCRAIKQCDLIGPVRCFTVRLDNKCEIQINTGAPAGVFSIGIIVKGRVCMANAPRRQGIHRVEAIQCRPWFNLRPAWIDPTSQHIAHSTSHIANSARTYHHWSEISDALLADTRTHSILYVHTQYR